MGPPNEPEPDSPEPPPTPPVEPPQEPVREPHKPPPMTALAPQRRIVLH